MTSADLDGPSLRIFISLMAIKYWLVGVTKTDKKSVTDKY